MPRSVDCSAVISAVASLRPTSAIPTPAHLIIPTLPRWRVRPASRASTSTARPILPTRCAPRLRHAGPISSMPISAPTRIRAARACGSSPAWARANQPSADATNPDGGCETSSEREGTGVRRTWIAAIFGGARCELRPCPNLVPRPHRGAFPMGDWSPLKNASVDQPSWPSRDTGALAGRTALTRKCHLANLPFRRHAPDRQRAHILPKDCNSNRETNGGVGSAMRFAALAGSLVGSVVFAVLIPYNVVFIVLFALCAILSAIGIWDLLQSKHSVRRNYPILANIRFMLEKIRPEIRQYFLESETDGAPFNRSKRAVAYQRAKGALDKRPFGTQQDIYGNNFEWINHSIVPCPVEGHDFRITVGGAECRKPYALSLFNISAMSFGALSANAIRALNRGAKLGGFAHDTGEGGISRYHREFGGDLIWEIGSGYFGCRNEDGSFCTDRFAAQAQEPQVKMVEIKLSQGAKPGHGGVLPGAKVTAEIANARGVPIGVDCISPARHSAFNTPVEMMHFLAQLRGLSGGKPVGFKLCIGHAWEFMALCKAMLETGIRPDFIVIDGSEGGTGAAPLEFVDHVSTPLREGLVLAHNCLVGAGLRQSIRLGASGRW